MQALAQQCLMQHRSVAITSPLVHAKPYTTARRSNKRPIISATSATGGASGSFGSTSRGLNYDSVSFRQDSGARASTSSVIDDRDSRQNDTQLQEVKEFLRGELEQIFSSGVGCFFALIQQL